MTVPLRDQALADASFQREERLFNEWFDARFDAIFSEADTVGPQARHKLKGILRHYAKDPHPFRACVRDNAKRFGPGRVDKVCGTLKDIIRGQTYWRGHPELDHGVPGAIAASSPPYELTEELAQVILSIDEDKLDALMLDAGERYEMTVEFARRSRRKAAEDAPPQGEPYSENGATPPEPPPSPSRFDQLIERQKKEAELLWEWVKKFGKLDKTSGPNGSHFMEENPFVDWGIQCGNCVFFTPNNDGSVGPDGAPLGVCDLVDGPIETEDLCKFWIIPGDKINDSGNGN